MNKEALEIIAAACHSVNRAWCLAHEDTSQVAWEYAAPEIRDICISGVTKALAGETPKELHESWCVFKREHGWVYGTEKSEANKTHPCLVAYDQLPALQQAKDALFSATVKTMAAVLAS